MNGVDFYQQYLQSREGNNRGIQQHKTAIIHAFNAASLEIAFMLTPSITILQGIPASGKSTWARSMSINYSDTVVVINRDSLRKLLIPGEYSKVRENLVRATAINMVKDAIKSGFAVIIDETNTQPHQIELWTDLAKELGVLSRIKSFEIDINTAITRDSDRNDSVGKDVIIKMQEQLTLNFK